MHTSISTQFRFRINQFLLGIILGITCGAVVTATYFHQKWLFAERQHRIEINRAMARLLMWDVSDQRLKSMPIHAFKAWFPFAEFSEREDGSKRYEWINYSAQGDNDHGLADRQVGAAWLVFNKSETVREIGYVSCD